MKRKSALTILALSLLIISGSMGIGSPPVQATSPNTPGFDVSKMDASMKNAYAWAVSRTLPNGTATLAGTSNNLLATSLVGRVLTYVQLDIGNATSLALINKMIGTEDTMLQNPGYIAFGIWPTQSLFVQLQVHRDVQKFLLRAYGLTLNPTARSDFIRVTQDIYLNMPGKYEYFDTIAWGLADAVSFAFYSGSQLPHQSDFTAAVQDLNLHYNSTAARADSANSFIDYSRLLHYLRPLEYTDSKFRPDGDSLNQTYQSLEVQLANQLLTRQLPNGNISSLRLYKAYLVEDYAKDLDSVYYLNHNSAYVLSAFKSESFLTSLYLLSNGNISLPRTGQGFDPIIAYHLVHMAEDIKPTSVSNWQGALSQASMIINHTLSIQSPDGTFRFYTNTTNPGFAYTTISAVSTIVDTSVALRAPSQTTSTTTVGTVSGTNTLSTPNNGNGQSPQPNLTGLQSSIPSWVLLMAPVIVLIAASVAYEARHRNRHKGFINK